MGALFSTQGNWMIKQTEGFVKGTGKFFRNRVERSVKKEIRREGRSGSIGKGIVYIGESLSKGANKVALATTKIAHSVTQKGRNIFRKNNNDSYKKLPNDKSQIKTTNPELLTATANENAARANSKKNAAAQSNGKNNGVSTELNNTTVAANNAAAKKAAAKKAAENNASIFPASSDLTQTTVSNTANPVVIPNSVINSGSTVQNTSSTNSANQTAKIIQNVDNLLKITISNNNPQKFLDLIKLLLLLQKITKEKSLKTKLKNILENVIKKCGGKCGDLAERKTKTQGRKTNAYYAVSEDGLKEALEKLNSEYKNKSNSKLKIDINEMLKKIYKEYSKSTPENEIPQINSPNNNASSNANTVVDISNQNNLTEELSLLDKPQTAVTSGGSHKKSKKSRS
jgi:hypothetical protein